MSLTRIYYVKTIVSGSLSGVKAPAVITVDTHSVLQWMDDAVKGRKFKSCAGGSDYTIEITRTEIA